ncbi:hypothetical protein MHU86_2899 [Fragilaria crotonensis]|nr:hypothetical protein MHU86_2899 [Fragilaria crotonensis]
MRGESELQSNSDAQPNQVTRKRRLSKKERKSQKKQKLKGSTSICPSTVQETSRVNTEVDATTESKPQQVTASEPDYLANYEPIEIPKSANVEVSSLGKWFPKAKVIKSALLFSNDKQSTAKASLLLFYQYANWSESKVDHLIAYLAKVAETRKTLGGRIRIAPEGVNATVSSVDSDVMSSQTTLRHFCEDLRRFDPIAFASTDFKFIDGVSPDRHFKDLKLLPVKELVFYGIRQGEAPLEKGGTHVDAQEFHKLLEKDSTVVIDVRNHYEAAIGRFNGQEGIGAEYVDPKMRKSTDFPAWLERPETKEKLKGKQVLMYCTGGVRCERASAYVNTKLGDQVKGIYQLQGGIERYLKAFPDGGHWRGKNFVFDKREAVSAGDLNGDGGVVRKSKDATKRETHCCLCNTPWDRYVGKKKCTMCGVPVLMCTGCMSNIKKDTNPVLRCPLCVEEDITVPAADVEYTDNGVSGRLCKTKKEGTSKKAAPSVLKWGGGHAHSKKEKKKEQRRATKLHKVECQFGKDCSRPDCFFYHPDRGTKA